mmetsp:Transcript_75355/g.233088  ORF Transcript_75355/g.233088 Transcript_75355/m.233088 type:complete len:446 (+) Transcript_75355:192-1529(+)
MHKQHNTKRMDTCAAHPRGTHLGLPTALLRWQREAACEPSRRGGSSAQGLGRGRRPGHHLLAVCLGEVQLDLVAGPGRTLHVPMVDGLAVRPQERELLVGVQHGVLVLIDDDVERSRALAVQRDAAVVDPRRGIVRQHGRAAAVVEGSSQVEGLRGLCCPALPTQPSLLANGLGCDGDLALGVHEADPYGHHLMLRACHQPVLALAVAVRSLQGHASLRALDEARVDGLVRVGVADNLKLFPEPVTNLEGALVAVLTFHLLHLGVALKLPEGARHVELVLIFIAKDLKVSGLLLHLFPSDRLLVRRPSEGDLVYGARRHLVLASVDDPVHALAVPIRADDLRSLVRIVDEWVDRLVGVLRAGEVEPLVAGVPKGNRTGVDAVAGHFHGLVIVEPGPRAADEDILADVHHPWRVWLRHVELDDGLVAAGGIAVHVGSGVRSSEAEG